MEVTDGAKLTPNIFNKVELLYFVIRDIEFVENEMAKVSDPALLLEYVDELKELKKELTPWKPIGLFTT